MGDHGADRLRYGCCSVTARDPTYLTTSPTATVNAPTQISAVVNSARNQLNLAATARAARPLVLGGNAISAEHAADRLPDGYHPATAHLWARNGLLGSRAQA